MRFRKTTFPSGLRVITIPVKGSRSVTVMVAVETGSDYESKKENGLAHFLEHMCFKGTIKRPTASLISQELDALGAENNAFTSNEFTGYWAKAARKHFHKLFEIVSDLYLNPTFPPDALEKERGVILEEINMYEDLPQRNVWRILFKLMYGDTPAGRSTLGTRESIRSFTRKDFIKYHLKHYVAEKTIVVVAGNITERSVVETARKYLKEIPRRRGLSKPLVRESQRSPAVAVLKKKTDQAHMIIAFRAYRAGDKRIPALSLLAEILGKGMSSRLFVKLRDELGACYYVRADNHEYTDHGMLTIATGVNVSRLGEVTGVIIDECRKLVSSCVSREELDKAKEHYIGHLYMGLETTDALADFYLDQEVTNTKIKNPEEIEKEIRRVTPRDVLRVARDIFRSDRVNLAVIGDVSNKNSLRRALFL